MKLFWKIFAAVFITFVAAVSVISYLVILKQIAAAEHGIVEKYRISGDLISREIEHGQTEFLWPFDTLSNLTQQQGFLFWWVVRDDGVIHLADKAETMGTNARDYLPQITPGDAEEKLILDRKKNYGLFIKPLEIGKKKWSLWLGFSLTQIREIKNHIILVSLLVSLAASLGLGTILYLAIKHFLRPIDDLTLGADSIGQGNLSHRVEIRSGDELGRLADAFNNMATDLQMTTVSREALRASERFLADIIDSIQDGINIIDTDFNILRTNPETERRFCQALPLPGKKCYTAFHGLDQPCQECAARECMENGKAGFKPATFRGESGEITEWVEICAFPIFDPATDKVRGVIEYVRDLTQQKQAEAALRRSEENLRQSQKMEAVGRLAGGVAHDFNNLLTAIIGYCELLHGKCQFEDPRLKDLEEIQRAAERAASLTRQLLAFSRKQIFAPKVLNLNDLVMNLDKMLRRLVSEDIELVTVPAENLGEVMADPGQIEQVILNLAVNARDAMPEGGVLTIETLNIALDENYHQKYGDVQAGQYVMLAVSDTGAGMDEASRACIFEPFFTTKEMGKGTGLGLSTVHGIIKQSGGHIAVYSEVGQGTTFKIYLPRLSQSEGHKAAAPVSCPLDHGTETILLVEDEDMVRHVARRILEINGYTVLEAASGHDALAVSQRAAGPIHLMLTDVVMPGISGGETAQMLKVQRPDLKVLFMSGHTENSIVHHGVLDSEVAFLQKPFKSEVLARKVREVLDGSCPLQG